MGSSSVLKLGDPTGADPLLELRVLVFPAATVIWPSTKPDPVAASSKIYVNIAQNQVY